MATVIAFANQKGGVGKTTLAVQLAYYLQLRKNKKVLFVDMDAQGSATETLTVQGEYNGTLSAELFSEEDIEIHVQKTERGIDLIGATADADEYEAETVPLELAPRPAELLKDTFAKYDYVIIDCPPTLGRRLVACLIMAQYVVTPITFTGYSVSGLTKLNEQIENIKHRANRRLKFLGIIVNGYTKTATQKKLMDEVQEMVGDLMFKSIVCRREQLGNVAAGYPITAARNGQSANREITALFEEMLTRIAKS